MSALTKSFRSDYTPPPAMARARTKRGLRVVRWSVLLTLLCGWSMGPLTSVLITGDGCRMSCCAQRGLCCCQSSRDVHHHRLPEDAPQHIDRRTLLTPCPATCVLSYARAQQFVRYHPQILHRALLFPRSRTGRGSLSAFFYSSPDIQPAPPRAPPFDSLISFILM